MPPRHSRPPGQPAPRAAKPESALLSGARRFAETEAVRALGAVLAVAVVAFLATLVWLWAFGK